MAGEKRFRTAFLGFNRSDVNLYIERILKEFEEKLRDKDEEMSVLKAQNKDLKSKYEELSGKSQQLNEDKAKIAEALLRAQEKAEIMVMEAVNQANEEKKKIERLIEIEKERLVDMKTEIKFLKTEVVSTLKKYENQLGELAKEELAG